LEVPGDVVPERFDRRVAAGGILLERAQADRVEVAGEPARELVGVARRAGGTLRALAPDGSRRETHFRTQRRRGGGERIALLYGIRVAARQELVQDEAEAVDVRRHADGLAAHLLRRRVPGREDVRAGRR